MKTYRLLKGYATLTKDEYKKFTKSDTYCGEDYNPEELKRFETEEDALEELKKYRCTYIDNGYYWTIEEYAIEEFEADEDGEFVTGSNFWPAEEADEENE